ncbi:hypothetical protein [Vampirovibrio sp.]|uniref:hypothetical protein n=1 Tax=Vampirovibrio sp. TaxID=2717857 RepID=UPI0035946079
MLINLLSQPRLKAYGLGKSPESLVFARYKWNLALSQALYPSLSLLEVGLRNQMDAALTQLYGLHWLEKEGTYWIRTPRMINQGFPNPEQDAVLKAKQKLLRENGQWSHPKLVAELNFGFWISLFKSHYHPVIWQRKEKPMRTVFQDNPKLSPKQAYAQLDRVRVIRNRIAHQEAIWNRQTLYDDYQTLLGILGDLGAPLKSMAVELDTFPKIWAVNPG